MADYKVLKEIKRLGLKVTDPKFRLKEGYLFWDVPEQSMLKNAIEMYNLYVDEKIGDFTQISSGGFKSNCVERDKDLLKQFIIIKEYLLLKHIQQKLEKERKENEGVLCVINKVHDILQVSEEKVTPDVLVEGESSVSSFSEASQSESSCSEEESRSISPEIVKVKEFWSNGTTTDDQIQRDEKVVQIINLFLKPRNKKRKKKRKSKSKMKKVWMPKVQVPTACEKVEKAEVNNVQRKFHSGEYVRSWK